MTDEDNLPAQQGQEPLKAPVPRDENGRFVKGVSGNPGGRKKGSTNYIKEVQLAHEATLREFLAEPEHREAVEGGLKNIIRIMQEGEDGHAVAAGKLLLDKLMPKGSTSEEDTGGRSGPIQIVIEAPRADRPVPGIVIEQPKEADDDDVEE